MFVKSRSDWYSLDWSGAEHYTTMLSMNGESEWRKNACVRI